MSAAQQWEYAMLRPERNASLDRVLREAGREGWEAWHLEVSGRRAVVFVKRPAPLPVPEETTG